MFFQASKWLRLCWIFSLFVGFIYYKTYTSKERNPKRLKGWESESVPEKKRVHAGTSLDGGALHFFTHTALDPRKVQGTVSAVSAVFTVAILSPPHLHWLPRWHNMSNQVQPSQKKGESLVLKLKMGNGSSSGHEEVQS